MEKRTADANRYQKRGINVDMDTANSNTNEPPQFYVVRDALHEHRVCNLLFIHPSTYRTYITRI
jgi:hypothetical protein